MPSWRRESNPRPGAYKAPALPLSYASISRFQSITRFRSRGRFSRPVYNDLKMTEPVDGVLTELREGLGRIYAARLKGVFLIGSYARGEQTDGSDLDVVIILDNIGRYGEELERTGELASNLSLRAGVSISRVIVSERDWTGGDTPFLHHAKAEAVPA